MQSDYFPLVSVIVPVYNAERYLSICLDSIINQTYKNLEIIIVNDGSTDDSPAICEKYARYDARIKLIHKLNGGIISARKAGVNFATGKYIAQVDADDWIEHDMYECMVEMAGKTQADVITAGMYRDYAAKSFREMDNIPTGIYIGDDIKQNILPTLMYGGKFFTYGINPHISNKLFYAELMRRNQLAIDDFIAEGEDSALVYPCILDAKRIVVTDFCHYHYCVRMENSFMDVDTDRIMEKNTALDKYLQERITHCAYKKQKENLIWQTRYLCMYLLALKKPDAIIKIAKDGTVLPFSGVKKGENVILYGSGRFGTAMKEYFDREKILNVLLWVDTSSRLEKGIDSPEDLYKLPRNIYQHIIIAVLKANIADEIIGELMFNGLSRESIAWIEVENFIAPKFE